MERSAASFESDLNLKATELRLGLPGRDEQPSSTNKRSSSQMEASSQTDENLESSAPPPKAQVVGWPPVRCYRKNALRECGMFVKVSMDGAPYLRKIDLKLYGGYGDLVRGLEKMLKCRIGSEYAPTYQDRDGDWMLVGDVPWEMFACSCTRLRIIKAAEAKV